MSRLTWYTSPLCLSPCKSSAGNKEVKQSKRRSSFFSFDILKQNNILAARQTHFLEAGIKGGGLALSRREGSELTGRHAALLARVGNLHFPRAGRALTEHDSDKSCVWAPGLRIRSCQSRELLLTFPCWEKKCHIARQRCFRWGAPW